MSSLQKLARRFMVGSQAINQGLANFSTDLRLLFHGSRNGVILRQKKVDGFQMVVRAEEEVGREVYYKGVFEGEETKFFQNLVGKSSICFDVGANIGYYSLLFASLNPQGVVHCFEPVPLNYHVLCTNSLMNGFSNLNPNLCAVGDREGCADLVISRDSAYSSLVDTGRKPAVNRVSVCMTTLDAYCQRHEIARIDILKVDVEGAEGKVLCGAEQVLRDPKRRPHTVMLELYEPMLVQYGTNIEEIFRKMQCFGYRAFVLANGRLIHFQPEHHSHLYNVFFEQCERVRT
jgi:FkbM family methyltransferase